MQFPEPGNGVGKHIVLHHTPIFLLIAFDDGEIIIFQQSGAMHRLSRLLIGKAFAFSDIWWHEETNTSVGTTSLLGVFGIILLVHDMVVQKSRFFTACMSNQRFLLKHFKLESIAQEVSQLVLDFFFFLSWTCEAEERIICISYVVEPPIGGIVSVILANLLRL